MKKKIGSILLIILLMITMLFTLTACGDEEESEDKDEKKSTSSSVDEEENDDTKIISKYEEAINDGDTKALMKLCDFDDKVAVEAEIDSNKMEDILNEYFEDPYYSSYKINETTQIKKKKDLEKISDSEVDDEEWEEYYQNYLDDGYRMYYLSTEMTKEDGDDNEGDFDILFINKDNKIACSMLISFIDTIDMSNVLSQVHKTDKDTEKSLAEDNFNFVIVNAQTDFLASGDLGGKFSDFLTFKILKDKLEEFGYILCSKTSLKEKDYGDSKLVVGEDFYIAKDDEENEDMIYHCVLKEKSGSLNVEVETFEFAND